MSTVNQLPWVIKDNNCNKLCAFCFLYGNTYHQYCFESISNNVLNLIWLLWVYFINSQAWDSPLHHLHLHSLAHHHSARSQAHICLRLHTGTDPLNMSGKCKTQWVGSHEKTSLSSFARLFIRLVVFQLMNENC